MSEESLSLSFEELTVNRRAALRLLPNVQDPEHSKPMILSPLKSSRRVSISEDHLSAHLVNSEMGYCVCRATHGARAKGKYFWEFDFVSSESNQGHCRLGITTVAAKTETAAGFDSNGYSLRDIGGSFHSSKKYDGPSFAVGDTIGFGLVIDSNVSLHCWINGKGPTLLFENIKMDEWIPSFSLYRDAVVCARFEEPFKFPADDSWLPISCHPIQPITEKYSPKEIIKIMKSGKPSEMNRELLNIINQAMAPPEELQN